MPRGGSRISLMAQIHMEENSKLLLVLQRASYWTSQMQAAIGRLPEDAAFDRLLELIERIERELSQCF